MNDPSSFYAGLAPLYHLIYPDWDASIQRQATMLDSLIRDQWGDGVSTVLDVSCGIGTQTLGLARMGYEVTASDLSSEEVERARSEAEKRGLKIDFSVADMREAFDHHGRQFDLVVSADNSVPHLLTDEDILQAFRQFYECTRPGGGCLISVRDYDKEDLSQRQVKPYGIREEDGVRWLLWQVWDPRGRVYDVAMYFVEDRGEAECRTHVFRSTYYAIGIDRLMSLMNEAGFVDVKRLDGEFFQPIIVAHRKAQKGATADGR